MYQAPWVEFFQIKWGQALWVDTIFPPDWKRVNVSAKNQWGQIPTVPIFSACSVLKVTFRQVEATKITFLISSAYKNGARIVFDYHWLNLFSSFSKSQKSTPWTVFSSDFRNLGHFHKLFWNCHFHRFQ